ncbi:gliding motility lipoprotein GldB [Mesonia ostreae]|uniref:Gliding motility lipoprotein GldB n=1 Tax=Mesonia ostreae TaxID=861110 RepID=A0ABU2KF94_9FLAO|nr:gliding motility lipoprotein GldB [Mesonia ostreae]MDT0293370.1 gliding motility lipoprotein GldB [Mesonia ostreae]
MKIYFLSFFILLAFASCKNDAGLEKEIAKIPIDFQVDRFDMEFAQASSEDLPRLKKKYPFLFPAQYSDSLWINQMEDEVQLELEEEVQKAFPDFESEKDEIISLFQHFKYYFPEFKAPHVVTIISEVDYRNKVVATDSLLLISLDTYLGEDHKFYDGMQVYLKKNFIEEQLPSDIAFEYAQQLLGEEKGRSFLEQIIYYGKILYVKDKVLPFMEDARKIGYTSKEIEWAQANEEQIWRYFIEKELLYKTDNDLRARFINIAPFSKFRLNLDNESPPQIGQYIGWQIVRQFANKNERITLKQLLTLDAECIFKEANFKPKKPE